MTRTFEGMLVKFRIYVLASVFMLNTGFISGCDNPEGKNLSDQYLTTLDGNKAEILFAEKRPLIINFWATWCRPCYEEIPLLVDANENMKDGGPIIIGVVLDTPAAGILEKLHLNYPVFSGYDEYGRALAKQAGLDPDSPYLPYTVFVDSDRNIVRTHRGILDRHTLERAMSEFN